MKKNFSFFTLIIFLALVSVSFFSCSGDRLPQILAKQSFDLAIEMLESVNNPGKIPDLLKRGDDLRVKISNLSMPDSVIYKAEVGRLISTEAGAKLRKLINSASSLQDNSNLMEMIKLFGF